jgi:hypothetical protein
MGKLRLERRQATRNRPPTSLWDAFRPDGLLTKRFDAKVCSLLIEARTLTRCLFEDLFMQGGLAEGGDQFVQMMVDDEQTIARKMGSGLA